MEEKDKKIALIIGAGPGGLTAAYELQTRSSIEPVVFEKLDSFGGISRTVNYKGNRMDIGGHRFFSKSDRVMDWWEKFLPTETNMNFTNNKSSTDESSKFHKEYNDDEVMLVRNRFSRILYLGRLFDYPIQMSYRTAKYLGFSRLVAISISYIRVRLFPLKKEKNLEDFFINRFGKTLYKTFFKDYTEKVWGVSCQEIKPEWGAQRIKGLSFKKALIHAIKSKIFKSRGIRQKEVETSLIERFLYPKFGPGQLWDVVAKRFREAEGNIVTQSEVVKIQRENEDSIIVTIRNTITGELSTYHGNYLISTMPIKELISCMGDTVPLYVKKIAEGLVYRDFITVGLLLRDINIDRCSGDKGKFPPDNWIYIQENDVAIGRLQIFNNWSPYLVADNDNIWIGLEYFCNEGDELWSMNDQSFIDFAVSELIKLGIINDKDVLDSTIVRVPKAYPAYFGSYDEISEIQKYLDSLENIYPVGRNGMHKYNNQDHSMLTAMITVDNILTEDGLPKVSVWEVNTEKDYHEEARK